MTELPKRAQLAVERILEDESLTGDLSDAPAKALIAWATAQIARVAKDPAISDEAVGAHSKAVRGALVAAAGSGVDDAAELLALAEQKLAAETLVKPAPGDAQAQPELAPSKLPEAPATAAASASPKSPASSAAPAKPAEAPANPAPAKPKAPHHTTHAARQALSWLERMRAWLRREY